MAKREEFTEEKTNGRNNKSVRWKTEEYKYCAEWTTGKC